MTEAQGIQAARAITRLAGARAEDGAILFKLFQGSAPFRIALGALTMPPADYEQLANGKNGIWLHDVAHELESIARRARFLAMYFAGRGGDGRGDQGHTKAFGTAAEVARKVARKAWRSELGHRY